MRLRPFGCALLLTACAAVPPAGPPGPIAELQGRTPGPPRNCVSLTSNEALRSVGSGEHVLLYGSGGTIWLNRPEQSCAIDPDDIIVTQQATSSLCRGDLIRSVHRTSGIPGPTCFLGVFVPYSR
jgi:hypothetical protein